MWCSLMWLRIIKPSPHDRWQVMFHTEKGASWVVWHPYQHQWSNCVCSTDFLTALIIILIPELSISKEGCSTLQIFICQSLSRKFERIFLFNSGRILIDFLKLLDIGFQCYRLIFCLGDSVYFLCHLCAFGLIVGLSFIGVKPGQIEVRLDEGVWFC